MTDAAPVSRTAHDSTPNPTPQTLQTQTQTPGHQSATPHSHPSAATLAPPDFGTANDPPPSPRFRPKSQVPTRIPSGPQFSQPRALPSSSTTTAQNSPAPVAQSSSTPSVLSPARVKVKSLSHIQSFVLDERNPLSQSASRSRPDRNDSAPQYEISEMPVTDIIEMVAGLLTKITTTNDRQHEHLHRQIPPPEGTAGLSPQTTSVLAFHGKNVPSISILSYLSRIHKYCPTTYEVFLSLLVYFDRMTERVNSGPMQSLRQASQQSLERQAAASDGSRHSSVSSATLAQGSPELVTKSQQRGQDPAATPPPSGSLGKPAEAMQQAGQDRPPSPPVPTAAEVPGDDGQNLSHFFVVDSFNIHRLVIAGVTCASKFFSDIFYTNSRYAKVGGLPLPELNHLELQFLLLNDFRLAVPLEEMEAYGTMLVEFYAREVLANNAVTASHASQPPATAVS
ncbi:cyclin-domain-containing protein [Tothia fuscella]|uniref:Cyclin-domain-containing protein n=1 Tax=Tothia fuscella TaxID=1048955 RepID=A0A9P4NPZ9_9PEZI|nr:cyclin-domain-containing protein [Tothia fuscella]